VQNIEFAILHFNPIEEIWRRHCDRNI